MWKKKTKSRIGEQVERRIDDGNILSVAFSFASCHGDSSLDEGGRNPLSLVLDTWNVRRPNEEQPGDRATRDINTTAEKQDDNRVEEEGHEGAQKKTYTYLHVR